MLRITQTRFARRALAIALLGTTIAAGLPARAQQGQAQQGGAGQTAAQQAQARQNQPGTREQDIVATVKEQGTQFSVLALALEAAGLEDQLSGSGPFTFFAPTDEAFAALPAGTLIRLLQPENRNALRTVLLHHVVQGQEISPGQIINKQQEVQTMAGGPLSVEGRGRVVRHIPTGGYKLIQQGDQTVIDQQDVELAVPQIRVSNAGGRGAIYSVRVENDQPTTTGSTTSANRSTPASEAGLVVIPQIEATNGVIHAITALLVPQEAAQALQGASSGQGQPRQ